MDAEGRNDEYQASQPGKNSWPPFVITECLQGGESRILSGVDNLA